ncbi:MAG: hypothetical protein PHI12_06985 [Dehalococcoidales bacterium]|nr:hypothetical protein [Dehalococcoidales bacterium]
MPSWEETQKMIREAKTPRERAEAARAMGEHIPQQEQNKHLVTMSKGGVNAVRLGNLPDAMQNPEVYNRVKKAVGGKK